MLVQTFTSAAHHEICNIVMANVHFIEFVLKCHNNPKIKDSKILKISLERLFFDFRGMYLTLLAF